MKMKGKRVIAGMLLVGILAVTLSGCKNTDENKKETEKPVITLGSDSYPPYTYLNEDGVPTGIDVELATEAFRRMGYQVDNVHLIAHSSERFCRTGYRSVQKNGLSGGRCPDQLGEEKRTVGERGDRLHHGLFFHGRAP